MTAESRLYNYELLLLLNHPETKKPRTSKIHGFFISVRKLVYDNFLCEALTILCNVYKINTFVQ